MKSFKVLAALICAVLLLSVSAFAGGKGESDSAGKEKVIWAAYGYLDEGKADRIKADFEAKYPQYEVEYVDLGSTDYLVRLDTALAGGERYDMCLSMSASDYVPRAKEGLYVPIEKYLTDAGYDLEDAFGSGIKASYINKKLYGLPYTKGGFYVFYNKDMFDAAGIPYPTNDWTWAEFEQIAKKLTKDGVYGANVHLTWGYDIETLPAKMAGWTPFANGDIYKANMTDKRLKDALEMWYRMQRVDKSAIQLSTFKTEQIGSRVPFAKGQAAMLLSNWWSATWMMNAKFGTADGKNMMNFKIGVVNIPRPNTKVPNNLNSTELDWYFAVPTTAKNPKGGALLAMFMITEEWPKLGTLSSYRHEDLNVFMKKFVTYKAKDGTLHTMTAYDAEFVKTVMGGWTEPITAYYKTDARANPEGLAQANEIYGQERELYYNGEQDIEKTIASMQKRLQAELDAQKKAKK